MDDDNYDKPEQPVAADDALEAIHEIESENVQAALSRFDN